MSNSNLLLNNVADWVEYIQGLHVREIDLSLGRVREVHQRLQPNGVDFKIITVAGTNGKGSTCEILASIYHCAGYSTGKYTSPHLEFFNERFSINHRNVLDQELLSVFRRVEKARENVRLTYFEFGTLIAIELFADTKVDVAIMEVGLGGRLDAVNILDPDVAIITSISIDHTDWLGDTVEKIALEKIGVSRPHKPCVVGFSNPPKSLLEYCDEHRVQTHFLESDYEIYFEQGSDTWQWRSDESVVENLPLPFSQSGTQLNNAATSLMTVQLLQNCLPMNDSAILSGVSKAHLAGRCEIVSRSPLLVLDVAHNQASVARLAEFIREQSVTGNIYAICGMLKDKEIEQSLLCLADLVDEWHFVSIHNQRGSSAKSLAAILADNVCPAEHSESLIINDVTPLKLSSFCYEDLTRAYNEVFAKLGNQDALIVFGSFFIVGDILRVIQSEDAFNI